MKITCLFCFLIVFALSACKRHAGLSGSINAGGITLQAEQIKNAQDDPGMIYLRIRVHVDPSIENGDTRNFNNTMWYKNDSCFFLLKNHIRINAALLQPVAAGVSGVYEYLAEFEYNERQPNDTLLLAFYDKNITHKQYLLNLKN